MADLIIKGQHLVPGMSIKVQCEVGYMEHYNGQWYRIKKIKDVSDEDKEEKDITHYIYADKATNYFFNTEIVDVSPGLPNLKREDLPFF